MTLLKTFRALIDGVAKGATSRSIALALALVSGCAPVAEYWGDSGLRADSSTRNPDTGPLYAQDASIAMPPPARMCAASGTGEITVQLQLAPDANNSDIWLVALCGETMDTDPSNQKPVRIVRVERGASRVTLRGLGDGYYHILTSVQGSPAGMSGLVPLEGDALADTFVSVGGRMQPMFTAESSATPDAGPIGTRDGGVVDSGAALPSGPLNFALNTLAGTALAQVGLLVQDSGSGFVSAGFALENTCVLPGCPALNIQGVELRIEHQGQPTGLLVVPLGMRGSGQTVRMGQRSVTNRRLLPARALAPGARLTLTVFGTAD